MIAQRHHHAVLIPMPDERAPATAGGMAFAPATASRRRAGEGTQQASTSEDARQRSAQGQVRILVVEDDHHIGRLVERILVREGFEVVRVMDVESAWGVLDQPEAVDLLFTDVVLPGASSGAELAAKLRALRPDLPIILTTGYDQSRIADHPGLLESVAFLPKPFTAAQVRDLVRLELGRS